MRRAWLVPFVLAVAGCGGSADAPAPTPASNPSTLSADGISIELPDGWTGRILIGAAGRPVLHAASYPVEANDTDAGQIAQEAMGINGMYLNVRDLGEGDAGGSLPIRFQVSDFEPAPFEGDAKLQAMVEVSADGEDFRVKAVSGGSSAPPQRDLDQLNNALATLELVRYRAQPAEAATGDPIEGFGLHANVPQGWKGGIARGEVHAGDASIDVGISEFSSPDAASFVTGQMPLTIGPAEFVHPPNGTGYKTGRSFVEAGRQFQLWVRTSDEHPTAGSLERVNAFLASFRAERGDFYPGEAEPATFEAADGWHAGSTGPAEIQPDGQATFSWAATIPYRDEGSQWPPHATLAVLPPDGIVLTVQLEQYGSELQPRTPFRLDEFHQGTFEGLGAENAPRYFRGSNGNYNVTIWALFGREQPTQEQLARAQEELDRLELPDWPD